METEAKYYSLRFRTSDSSHRRGDKLNYAGKCLFIGQTPECEFRLPQHPEYEDTCYAVIVRNGDSWNLIRQEQYAAIIVNNEPLGIIHQLQDNDHLTFDKTEVQFSISEGTLEERYTHRKSDGTVWGMFALLGCIIFGIIAYIYQQHKPPTEIFKEELSSIYVVRVDSVCVRHNGTDTYIALNRASIGTGFVTNEGYFVTARHCVEPWLAMENEVCDDFNQIKSEIVKYAILAEEDTSVHIAGKVTIMSADERQRWHCSSDGFLMDKERDNIYEFGNMSRTYLWRTLTGYYDDKESMLGDVAVMRWSDDMPHGDIALAGDNLLLSQGNAQQTFFGFGFPLDRYNNSDAYGTNETKWHLQDASTTISFIPRHPDDFLICNYRFDAGYSGGPIFAKNWTSTSKAVVGIISWADDQRTLIVPVSQVNRLIKQLSK